jgi:hypothetical protein
MALILVDNMKFRPLARLEALPEWWSGKAWAHREAARECGRNFQPKMADLHLRIARDYEAKAAGMKHPSILPNNEFSDH